MSSLSPRAGLWLKAGTIFAVSLAAATALGLGLSNVPSVADCGFRVALHAERGEAGLLAQVTWVEGDQPVKNVVYRVLQRQGPSYQVLAEGPLADALEGRDGVTYYPLDGARGVLSVGDSLLVEDALSTDVMLVTASGAPLGWTAGCE